MDSAPTVVTRGRRPTAPVPTGEPCLMVSCGASGDLTKRLLMAALYNLLCDGLLPPQFAVIGIALDELSTKDLEDHPTLSWVSYFLPLA